jgi:ribonuclease HI
MTVYVDGSCSGNGKTHNTGGFGVVVLDDNENIIFTYNEVSENTTNNREELKGILYAFLKYGVKEGTIPTVYSDSAYSVNTLTQWMFGWAMKGWLKSDNKAPENLDLIQAFYKHWQNGYRIDLKKVKGHSGQKFNELADKLAVRRN